MIKDAPLISQNLVDDLGREIHLDDQPKRIISLAPNITEMIYAIGAEDKLVARSHACNFPEAVYELPEIETYPNIDKEQILAHKPDLVLATDEILPVETVLFFEQFNIPVYFQIFDSIGDIYRHIDLVGKLTQREHAAKNLVDSLSGIEKKIVSETSDEIKYPTIMLISVDPLIVVGGGSFMNELITNAGAKNVFADKPEKYPEVTAEEVIASNPEYILIPSRFASGNILNELISLHPEFEYLPAVELGHVFDDLNPDLIYRPGPRSVYGLAWITRTLHPSINAPDYFDEGE